MTPRTHDTCTVPQCDRPHEAHGLCHTHYATYRRTGTRPTQPIQNRDPRARFNTKVHHTDTCWLWQGATDGGGRYGSFQYQGRVQRAHRVALKLAGTDVPDNMDVDHLCRVTLCVRPDHLEVVTHRTNVMRGDAPTVANAAKTHCPQGHPYDGDNLYIIPSTGGRMCRTCMRDGGAERQRRHRAKKRRAN